MTFTPTWYPLSGVEQYGVMPDGTFARRGYVLYSGRTPTEEYSEWRILGVLPAHLNLVVWDMLSRWECPDGILTEEAVRQGSLIPTGNGGFQPPTGEAWEKQAIQQWLEWKAKKIEKLILARQEASRLHQEADQWDRDNPNAGGGGRSYSLRRKARDLVHLASHGI